LKLDFPVEQTVRSRYSVRTYEEQPLSEGEKEKINAYIAELQKASSPFSDDVTLRLLEAKAGTGTEKLGTYGVIKGAENFIGAAVPSGESAMEALGYTFEKLILYLTHLGLGTCWLGGTFKRSAFAAAMSLKENELFPVVSPVGHPGTKKRRMENFARKIAKADQRKAWNELFFKNDFTTPLDKSDAGEYTFPLEMLRLAPSASNKQPWKVLKSGNAFHFYEVKTPGYGDKAPYDIQKADVGIAFCHFHMAALEKDLAGEFKKLPEFGVPVPDHTHYLFSWISTQK